MKLRNSSRNDRDPARGPKKTMKKKVTKVSSKVSNTTNDDSDIQPPSKQSHSDNYTKTLESPEDTAKCSVVVDPVSANSSLDTNIGKDSAQVNGKAVKVFKRSALVASTPLVRGELNPVDMPSNIQDTLSCSYWSDESQLSKISLRDYSQYQGGDILRSSGRKSRPVNKLQYTAEEKTPSKETKSGLTPVTKTGLTPKMNRGACAIRKLEYAQDDPVDVKKKTKTNNSRRVSFAVNKTNQPSKTKSSRRKSLTSKDYRRGSLVRKYLSSSAAFTNKQDKKDPKKPLKIPLPSEQAGGELKKVKDIPNQSLAGKKLLNKQTTKSLSKTFTSISGKSAAKLYEQSFALQSYLNNTSTYLPNVSISNLNRTDLSVLKKRRKKLYNSCTADKFEKSPVATDEEKSSIMGESSRRHRKVKKPVSSKTSFQSIVEDTGQESGEEFSSIKVDEEISVCVKTNSLNHTGSERRRSREKKAMQRSKDGESYLIHSREKSERTGSEVKEMSDGSFISSNPESEDKACPEDDIPLTNLLKNNCAEDDIPLSTLKNNPTEDDIPLSSFKNKLTEDDKPLSSLQNKPTEDDIPLLSLKTTLDTQKSVKQLNENKENVETVPSKGVLNTTGVKKRKKKLHGKSAVVFDLEASLNEERDRTYNANVTCNQSILASAISFNR